MKNEPLSDREFVRITAKMDQTRAVAKGIGNKRKVSEMELICLVNLAELACLNVFSKLEGETGEDAAAEAEKLVAAIRKTFSVGNSDGLSRLCELFCAMAGSERLGCYLLTKTRIVAEEEFGD